MKIVQQCHLKSMDILRHIWRYLVIILSIIIIETQATDNDTDLMTSLFSNYDSGARPVCGDGSAVQVKIGLAVRQIIDLNEPRQILESNAWIRLQWVDCHLTWNATETGITSLTVPNGKVWVPDITLYDNAVNELGGYTDYRQTVYPDGSVYYNFPSIIKSLCKVDVTFFPFDTQTCKLKFGSWAHHGWDLNVTAKEPQGDTSSYVSNGEWSIVGVPAVRHELLYGCCPEPYPDITFYIQLERKPLFYLLNLMFPCMLISSMALLGFLLPPDSGEKVSLEITVLLSLSVFLLVVSETMPPTSETFPFIGMYFAGCMLLVSLSCLTTVSVLNLHFKGDHGRPVPACLRAVFLNFLGRLVGITSNNVGHEVNKEHQAFNKDLYYENNAYETCESGHVHTTSNGVIEQENSVNKSIQEFKELHAKNLRVIELGSSDETMNVLHKQLQTLNEINDYLIQKRKLEHSVSEWQKLAKVADRTCLILFTSIQVFTSFGIILRIATADSVTELEAI